MADDGEIQRLTTVFDADYSKLNAKLDAVIRAQYGAAQKVQDAWKKAQASNAADQAASHAATLRSIQLENQLAIARAAGNQGAVQALTEQLRIQQQIAALRRAGVSPEDAKVQAVANVAALANAERAAAAARAEAEGASQARTLKSIELQRELSVAQITGDKARVKSLEEELLIEQQLTKLNAAGVTGPAALAQARAHAAALSAAEQPNLARAGRSVLDSTRFATLEEGGARLRVFGSALEPLGAYGIAAAAGVLAVSEALAQSHEAIEYADGLYKAAQAAHQTTTELQVMRIALEKAGGQAQEADTSLLEFSDTFGKAQDGLKRSQRGFNALGISPQELQSFKDAPAALDAVVAKIQNLKKPSDQDAAIDLLGLKGLAPLILAGADAWKTYREEAQKDILPPDVVARGHELNVQVDELNRKIKVDLTEAFINLGPILVGLVSQLAKITGGVEAFTNKLAEWARDPAVQAMIETSTMGVVSGESVKKFGLSTISEPVGAPKSVGELQGLLKTYFTPKTGKLTDLAPKGSDQTESFDKSAQDAAAEGAKAVVAAQAALIVGIHAHAQAEKDAVDAALNKKLLDLDAEAAKIKAAKNDADKKSQLALLRQAKIEEQDAAEAQKLLIDRNAAEAALEQVIQTRDFVGQQRSRIASNTAAEEPTAAGRNAIQRQSLVAQQKLELADFDARSQQQIDQTSDQVDEGSVDQSDLDLLKRNISAKRDALVAGQQSDLQKQDFDQQGPLDKYLHGIQDLNTAFQQDGVEAISSLSSVLAQMGENSKQAGSILEHWLLELALKVAEQEFTAEAAPALAAGAKGILGFLGLASGGYVRGPGTSTSDSIPTMLSDKEYVVNARATAEHRPLLEAINSGKVGKFAQGGLVTRSAFPELHSVSTMSSTRAGGVTVLQPVHFHAEGAVVTQDLLDQAQVGAERSARSWGQWARGGAVSDVQRASYNASLNQ